MRNQTEFKLHSPFLITYEFIPKGNYSENRIIIFM